MTTRSRPRWLLPLLAVAGLTGSAAIAGAFLVATAVPRLPPAEVEPPERAVVIPVSDVHWDAAAAKRAQAVPAVPFARGDEFHVTSEVDDPAVVSAVLDASKRALPLTLELLGGAHWPQRRPYEVSILRTRDRVKEEARRRGWQPPAQLLGFAELDTGRIRLTTDDIDDPADVLAAAGPGAMLTHVAAHEAAHQVAARCIEGAASGADWFCEGLAEFVGERVVMETYPGTELGAIPRFSRAMQTCRALRYAGQLPTTTEILTGDLGALDGPTRYAVHWAFFRFLMEPPQRDRMRQAIARIRELPWSGNVATEVLRVMDGVWPGPTREGMTRAFHEHVREFVPQWSSVGGRLEVTGTTWLHVGTPGVAGSYADRLQPAGRAEYSIQGSFEILPRGDGIAEVLLGETPNGRVLVSFQAGQGVGLWMDPERTQGRDRGPAAHFADGWRPAVGRRSTFAIYVVREKLRVVADSSLLFEWDLPGRDMTGAWGVGCANFANLTTPTGSAAIWRDVRLE